MVHNANLGDCKDAPRTERTSWTHQPDRVTCPTCLKLPRTQEVK